jgi:hypothetical protein
MGVKGYAYDAKAREGINKAQVAVKAAEEAVRKAELKFCKISFWLTLYSLKLYNYVILIGKVYPGVKICQQSLVFLK